MQGLNFVGKTAAVGEMFNTLSDDIAALVACILTCEEYEPLCALYDNAVG